MEIKSLFKNISVKSCLIIVLGCIIALIVVIKIGMWIIEPKEEKINTELLEISTKDGVYEFTYKTDNY